MDYIDKWITRKNEATILGNKGQRTMAKLMLNSLYGKFATSLDVQSKMPYLTDDGIVHYSLTEKEQKDGIYVPMRMFYNCICTRKDNSNKSSYKRLLNSKIWTRYVYLFRYRQYSHFTFN